MTKMSIGRVTDIAILKMTGSHVEVRDGFLVISTNDNPTYHWGNCIQVTESSPSLPPEEWYSTFKRFFPGADWIAIGLASKPQDTVAWENLGLKIEEFEVMASHKPPTMTENPSRAQIRMLEPEDFGKLSDFEIRESKFEGSSEPETFDEFVRATNRARAGICKSGEAAWFGAFVEEELVSTLGIIRCGDVARYQSVQTARAYRKQGLASHLLGVAGEWARQRGCSSWVIVTETNSDAGRLYSKAGFSQVESMFDVSLR